MNQFLKISLLIHSIGSVSVELPALLGPGEQDRLQSHFRFLGLLEDGGGSMFSATPPEGSRDPLMRNSHVVGRVGCDLRKGSRGRTCLQAGWEKEPQVREKGQRVIYEL